MFVHVSDLLSLLLLAAAWQGTSGQPCERGTMYQNGKCITCDRCYAGSEFNYTNFDKDMKKGYLSCPPCSPCPKGRYREPKSLFDTCKKCRKNCTAENKMWKTLCGDTSPGDCGNCMDGYVQGSIDSNSPCIKKSLLVGCTEGQYLDQGTCRDCEDCGAQNRTTEVRCRSQGKGKCGPCLYGYIEKETSKQCVRETYADERRSRRQEGGTDQNDNNGGWIVIAGIIVCVAFLLIIIGVVCLWVGCGAESGRGRVRGRSALSDSSDAAEAGKSTDSTEAFIQKHHDGGHENYLVDLETDGPTGSIVRAELMNETSGLLSNPAALPVSGLIQYPNYIITSEKGLGKDILMHIAKKIYGEPVEEFFRYLGVGKEEIYPERERFLKQTQEYIDFKWNLLLKWLQSNGRHATLDVLCDALVKANFHDVLNDVLAMYNEKTCRRPEANECHGEVGAEIGPSTAHCTQCSDTFSGTTD